MKTETAIQGSGSLLLNDKQVIHRINRLAYQIYEDNFAEKEIILAGILKSGYLLAEHIAAALKKISPLNIQLAEVRIDKHSQGTADITISIDKSKLQGKAIILIDDVLNSGKTMMYALKPFLAADIKKIRTAVLIDRNHKRFPVAADFSGLCLSTTLKEHIEVIFEPKGITAWLS